MCHRNLFFFRTFILTFYLGILFPLGLLRPLFLGIFHEDFLLWRVLGKKIYEDFFNRSSNWDFFQSNFSGHSLYDFFFGLFWVRRFQYCSKFSDTLITGALRRCQIICLQCLFDFLHYLFSRASVLDSNFAPNSKKRYFYDAPSLTCWIIKKHLDSMSWR